MRNIAGIILTAGSSTRMGSRNKLLLPFGVTSVIAKTTTAACAARFSEVIVVTGHEQELIVNELSKFPVRFVHNRAYATGMHSSIRSGVEALSPTTDAFAVVLGDTPLLKVSDLDHLIFEASRLDAKSLIIPVYENLRGHPVVISTKLRAEILHHPDNDQGCSYLFQRHQDEIEYINMQTDAIYQDIDTPTAYETLLRKVQNESVLVEPIEWRVANGNASVNNRKPR